jgi:hypothetical protein
MNRTTPAVRTSPPPDPSAPAVLPSPRSLFRVLLLSSLLLALLPGRAPCDDGGAVSFGAPEAERALVRHLAAVDDREFEVRAEAVPFLRKVLIARARLKDATFSGPRYLVHANGKVEPYTLEGYLASLREEGLGAPEGKAEGRGGGSIGRREIGEAIVSVDQPGAIPLRASSDIPSYCRRPLEADFAGAIRPPWFYEDGGRTYWFFYTWLEAGGVVTRYRISFRGDDPVPDVSVLRIGERVGEHLPPD